MLKTIKQKKEKVKNKINIVGQEEMGPAVEEAEKSHGQPNKFLENLLKKHGVKFESFKNRMIEKEIEGAADWESLSDIPAEQSLELAGIVQKLIEAKTKTS